MSLRDRVTRVGREAIDDNITGEAAKAAYYFFLSLFPMLLVLFTATGIIGGEAAFTRIMDWLQSALPDGATAEVEGVVREITDQRRPGAESLKTPRDMLSELGLKNIEIVPRIQDLTLGIDQLREDFPNYRIDEEHCAEGIKHLEGFSKVWNDRMGLWSPQIMKNGHQHAADALRQKAQWAHNMRDSGGQTRPRRANRSGMAA